MPSNFSMGSVQFGCSVVSDSLWPNGLPHARPSCPSPAPRVYSNSCPLSRHCHPTISSSVIPFSPCLQSFPASGSFLMSQLFASGGQSIGASASTSVLPVNTQDWSSLGWTGWISLQSKGSSRVFSNTTVQKHQFFGAQLSSWSNTLGSGNIKSINHLRDQKPRTSWKRGRFFKLASNLCSLPWQKGVFCCCLLSLVAKLCRTLCESDRLTWTVAHQAPLFLGFPRQEFRLGCHFLLQEIFLTQGSNPNLLYCRRILYHLGHLGSPVAKKRQQLDKSSCHKCKLLKK